MSYLNKILTIGALLFALCISAQNEIGYTVQSDQVSVLGTSKALPSTITKEGNALKWEQQVNGTSNTIVYQITNSSGEWDATNALGQLSCTLNKEGFTEASFTLTGTEGEGLKATLSVREGEQPALVYTFNITNITYP